MCRHTSRIHQEILSYLFIKIANYIDSKNSSCKIYPALFAVKLFLNRKTIVEPDISVICDPYKLTEQGCSGAPDWIIEVVSPNNSSHDYVRKLNLYLDAGVKEYWIADPNSRKILVYFLQAEPFGYESYTFQDTVKTAIFEDLNINFGELNV